MPMPLTNCEVNFYTNVPHQLINIYEGLKEQNGQLSRIADALERLADKKDTDTPNEDGL